MTDPYETSDEDDEAEAAYSLGWKSGSKSGQKTERKRCAAIIDEIRNRPVSTDGQVLGDYHLCVDLFAEAANRIGAGE